MNGFSTGEEDSRGAPDQVCCLVDEGDRCPRPAGNASYSKRIQKTVTQRRLRLHLDAMVSLLQALRLLSMENYVQLLIIAFLLCKGPTHIHLWFSQDHDTMCKNKETKERFRRWLQWNRHWFSWSRSFPAASKHLASVQETLQSCHSTWTQQSSACWCKILFHLWRNFCNYIEISVYHIIFLITGTNEALQNNTSYRKRSFDIFHLYC